MNSTQFVDAPNASFDHAPELTTGDELLTVQDAARLLKVSVSSVYEHVRPEAVDRLAVVKLGKYLRFDRRDLQAYIDAKRRRIPPPTAQTLTRSALPAVRSRRPEGKASRFTGGQRGSS